MKNYLLIVTLFLTTTFFSQNANISYEVRINSGNITGTQGSTTSGSSCWESGTKEYTAKVRVDHSGSTGTYICMEGNNSGNGSFGGGTLIRSATDAPVTNGSLTIAYDLYEDDGGSRCNWDNGDDCRATGSYTINVVAGTAAATNSYNIFFGPTQVYNAGSSQWNIRLDVSYRYAGTASGITPSCTPQNSTQNSGAIRSHSVSLTAGVLYRFRTTSGTDPFLLLYGTNGYTGVASNDDGGGGLMSLIEYTPTVSGTYYIETSEATGTGNIVSNINLEYSIVTPTTANAGADQTGSSTCGLTSVTLAGNSPSIGTGSWSIISGAGGSVTTPSSSTSTFTGTAGTTYTLRWTISNGSCTSTDDVVITFNQNPTANAGADQTGSSTCGLTSVTLAGNSQTFGTGAWSIISGSGGSVTTPSSATSAFTGTAATTYTLRWTRSNSPCTASTDDVVITFNQNPTTANAGTDQTGFSTCGLTSVTFAGNSPSVGTGAWSIISGSGGSVTTPSSAASAFTGTAGSTYTLRWTVSNSPCSASTDDVVITFNQNPTTANAGTDQTGFSTCGLTSVTLAGNSPSLGTGAWSIISGAGGSVTTPSSAASTFTGTAGSTYTLRWTISNSPCTASTDDVVITFNQNPTTANAGTDQTGFSTCGLTSVTLAANSPSVGTGAWIIISGTGGSVTTPSSVTSAFTGTAGSTYTLRWTISNSPCSASTDDVVITFNQNPTTANVGTDQTGFSTCGLTSVTLAANSPSVGTGAWSIISGTGGSVTTPSSVTSAFTGTAGSTYTLRWTISNSPCSASTDDVVITFNQNPTTANAGADQTGFSTCGLTSVTLAGNSPSVGTGSWSIISGTGGSVTTPSSVTSAFTGTAGSTYTLRWTISNSPCSASTDDVVITFNQNPTTANAGADQTGFSTCGLTSVNLSGNSPSVGTGAWSIISGTGGSVTTPSSVTSAFTGTAGSTYTLRWTLSNSPCEASTDDVVITFNQNPTTANAGVDQIGSSTCGLTSITLTGNSPSVGTGAWSIISGTGGSVTTPSSETSTFTGTAGSTYTLLWTISNSPCTASTDDVVITFNQNPTTVSVSGGGAICSGSSASLNASNGSSGTIYWQNTTSGGTSIETASTSQSVSNAGTYYFRARSAEGCWSTQGSGNITVDPTSIVGTPAANQTICRGVNPNPLTLTGNTGSIQWQSSADGISEWNNINIATASPLSVSQMGDLTNSKSFRAVVTSGVCDAAISDVISITVQQPSTTISLSQDISINNGDYLWSGNVDSNAGDLDNWYIYNSGNYAVPNAAPSTNDRVFIVNYTTASQCVDQENNAIVNTLTSLNSNNTFISAGATLELQSGANLTVAGDFINQGTFVPNNSTVQFTGSGTSTISMAGGSNTFNNLTINKTGLGNVALSSPIKVAGTLTMTSGNINTNSNTLEIGTSASQVGEINWTTGTVIGPLKRWFAAATNSSTASGIFPVGTATTNRYAQINFTQAPNGGYLVIHFKDGMPPGTNYDTDLPIPYTNEQGLTRYIQNADQSGYWEMTPYNAAGEAYEALDNFNYNLALRINNPTSVQTGGVLNNPPGVKLIRAKGFADGSHGDWELAGTYSTFIELNAGEDYVIKSVNVQGFSWFNGGGDNANPLPVELTSFNGLCEDNQTTISWQTASEFHSAYFEVQKSTDGENWRVIKTQDAAGNSTELLSYQAIDNSNTEQNAYYRLRQVDENGEENVYDPIFIGCDETTSSIKTYPNPSDNSFQVVINDKNLIGKATFEMVDTKGTIVAFKNINIVEGFNSFLINENIQPGVYYIKLTNADYTTIVVKHVVR